jgi:hypothetical protein
MLGGASSAGFSETDDITAAAAQRMLITESMARKVAIGIWSVLAFVLVAVVLNELLRDARPGSLFMSASLAAVSAWLAFRLWRRPSRTVAIIAACTGVAIVVIVIGSILQGSFDPFPMGVITIALFLAGGFLPLLSPEANLWRARSPSEQ